MVTTRPNRNSLETLETIGYFPGFPVIPIGTKRKNGRKRNCCQVCPDFPGFANIPDFPHTYVWGTGISEQSGIPRIYIRFFPVLPRLQNSRACRIYAILGRARLGRDEGTRKNPDASRMAHECHSVRFRARLPTVVHRARIGRKRNETWKTIHHNSTNMYIFFGSAKYA